MVKYQQADGTGEGGLDRTFAALSDPTRRALLAQLNERGDLSVSELAKPFAISLPAVMKHLDVLSDAGLVTRTKAGRTVTCRIEAEPMEEAMAWLDRYLRFWSAQLDRLAAFVEEKTCPPSPPPPEASSRASRSSVVSMRRRQKSTPPGPTRRKS